MSGWLGGDCAILGLRRSSGEFDHPLRRVDGMRIVGFGLLLAGWAIVLTAIVLLASPPSRAVFVLAGIAVQALGLALVMRSHLAPREERG